jgi:hypothetical protein
MQLSVNGHILGRLVPTCFRPLFNSLIQTYDYASSLQQEVLHLSVYALMPNTPSHNEERQEQLTPSNIAPVPVVTNDVEGSLAEPRGVKPHLLTFHPGLLEAIDPHRGVPEV